MQRAIPLPSPLPPPTTRNSSTAEISTATSTASWTPFPRIISPAPACGSRSLPAIATEIASAVRVSPSGVPNISVIRATAQLRSSATIYGNDMYINAAQAISGVPSSWPGYDLTIGASGKDKGSTDTGAVKPHCTELPCYPENLCRRYLRFARPLPRCGLFSVSSTSRQPESWIIRPGIRFQTFMWRSAVSQSRGHNGTA